MQQSKIEWTEKTWNPVRGCSRISEGCRFCYAERVAERWSGPNQPYEGLVRPGKNGAHPRWTGEVRLVEHILNEPKKWKKGQLVFVNSMSDLFHEKVPLDYIQRIFNVMDETPRHTYQILTKRAKRMAELAIPLYESLPNSKWPTNVWMGVSIEEQRVVERADFLCKVPTPVRFLSIEPLIGPIPDLNLIGIDWVIIGGESGPHARPMEPEWAIDIVQQCQRARIPCFMKQMGSAWAKRHSPQAWKGEDFQTFPHALRVREYPQEVVS